MKQFFGFKKNKCKQEITLPDIHSCSVNINEYVAFTHSNEILDDEGFIVKIEGYIPAKGFDSWEIPLKTSLLDEPLIDIPAEDVCKYTALVSFFNSDGYGNLVPNVLILTPELTNYYDDISLVVSVYNPTNFDMRIEDTHYLNITLIENV